LAALDRKRRAAARALFSENPFSLPNGGERFRVADAEGARVPLMTIITATR